MRLECIKTNEVSDVTRPAVRGRVTPFVGRIFPKCVEKEKENGGMAMYKVKVFDKEHEKDLEAAVNDFLARLKDGQLIDVKYSVAAMESEGEQIYCFSAMVIYRT
ncbi:UNVERIFIED_ORG: uncharacterized protein DUF2758 [Anoxybacillus amylolyticus]|nr:putative sporulation protein [Geobacillus sp. GHH01]AKM20114.1 Sporulation protein cse60 [Geobacillus sp. 12AMOR1]ATA61048.1 hypothetical protein GS458_2612 [Geobacillus stearothermophilus]KZE96778.1 Sporulation protein cse60 [Geobacillus stearothermophilus]STO13413.1 Protein of uncharacterised function (DUF2758) [[Flavobacterium] thermophilum]